MRYPPELSRQADSILSQRRAAALAEQDWQQKQVQKHHPDIWEERRRIFRMGAQLGGLAFAKDEEGIARYVEDMQAGAARISAALEEAGLPPDYLEPPFTCRECEDRGYAGGHFCRCRVRVLNELVYEMLSNTSKVDECSFDSFDLSYYTGSARSAMAKLLEASRRYAEEFSAKSPNLLFTGQTGLGKTHLSLAIAQVIVDSGKLVMYASAANLISRIVDSVMGDESEDQYRDIVYGCDLLIIDDLGTEMKTHITKTEVQNLINTRINEGRPTIINTNLSLKDIESTYDQRVTSRIIGCYVINQFSGEDIRFQKRRNSHGKKESSAPEAH